MQITVRVRRTIIVDNDVHTLNVDTTPKDVSGDQYTLLKSLKCCVTINPEKTLAAAGHNITYTYRSSCCRPE
jgi:hypothetical protein